MNTWKNLEVEVKFRSKAELSKQVKIYLSMFDPDIESEYFDYRYNLLIPKLLSWKVTKEYVEGYIEWMKDRIVAGSAALKNKSLDSKK